MGKLVPALALQPLDSADAADDGLDVLLERLEVCPLWQAVERLSKVDVGVLVRHLGEHLDQGVSTKLSGLLVQVGRPGGLKQLQGGKNMLEEL